MATGYRRSDGADLESVFGNRTYGSAIAATGFKNAAGTDLGSVLQPYVRGTKAPDTGFRKADGTDLSFLFQNAAEPIYVLGFNVGAFAAGDDTEGDFGDYSTATLTVQSTGRIRREHVGTSFGGSNNGYNDTSYKWVDLLNVGANAWVYLTKTSGDDLDDMGNINVWVPTSWNVSWALSNTFENQKAFFGTMYLSATDGGSIISTATVSIGSSWWS